MAPKPSKGKDVVTEGDLAKMQKKLVVFPPGLDMGTLLDRGVAVAGPSTGEHNGAATGDPSPKDTTDEEPLEQPPAPNRKHVLCRAAFGASV
ncbi:hypothetical protein D1007_00753 [Hordeum vulgare]|nr:hypothetical protein D1007_00753 [Hordeum vulgare]